jgi:hypothetical protein
MPFRPSILWIKPSSSVLGESPRFFCGGLADIRIPQADQGI